MTLNQFLLKYKAQVYKLPEATTIGGRKVIAIRTSIVVNFDEMKDVPQVNINDSLVSINALDVYWRDAPSNMRNNRITRMYQGCVMTGLKFDYAEGWVQLEFIAHDTLSYYPHEQPKYANANARYSPRA